ncbi:hypothetical protein CRM90_08160, partial [Mycobacterium sp. ENV421]
MSRNRSSGGGIGGLLLFLLVIGWLGSHMHAVIGFLVAVGIIGGLVLLGVALYRGAGALEERQAIAREQARIDQAARADAAARKRKEQADREKQQRIDMLGSENAARLESALKAVKQVGASEAAREGWLGDVSFSPDIAGITSNFAKAHEFGRCQAAWSRSVSFSAGRL